MVGKILTVESKFGHWSNPVRSIDRKGFDQMVKLVQISDELKKLKTFFFCY